MKKVTDSTSQTADGVLLLLQEIMHCGIYLFIIKLA